MEIGTLVFAGFASAAALASAVVSVVQALRASAAEKRTMEAQAAAEAARDESASMAAKATAAFIRQAEALELSNKLKQDESRPRDWTLVQVSEHLRGALNTSGRTLLVDRILVTPENAGGRVSFDVEPDGVYEPGDRVGFLHTRVMGRNAHKFTIYWRYQDEPASELNEFIVPL